MLCSALNVLDFSCLYRSKPQCIDCIQRSQTSSAQHLTQIPKPIVTATIKRIFPWMATALAITMGSPAWSSVSPPAYPTSEDAISEIEIAGDKEISGDENDTQLTIGIKPFHPFVFLPQDQDTAAYGYSIDLWNEIAEEQGMETHFVTYATVPDLLEAVKQGEVDAAIAALSITSERLKNRINFSHPYYQSGLQLMVSRQPSSGLGGALGFLRNSNSVKSVFLIMASSAIVGALIWALEHRHNEGFPKNPVAGVGQGTWFAIVTLGTFGYGDVTPMKWPARVITTIWMGISFFIVAHFISSMTVHSIESGVDSLSDLRGEEVGTVAGTTAEDFLRSQPVNVKTYESFEAATVALAAGEIQGVVRDYPEVQYFVSRNPDFEAVGDRLTHEDYGIAVAEQNEELLENIDYALVKLQEEGALRSLEIKWFGLDIASAKD